MSTEFREETDRGYAWVVYISGLAMFSVISLTTNMYGVLYIAMLDTYNEGESKTALVGALCSGALCFLSPLSTHILNHFGSRITNFIGAVTAAVGLAISAVVPSLDAKFWTAGVAVGFGYSMICCATVVSIGYYFKKYRNVAMATMYLSVGVGMFGSAPLGLFLIENLGLSSTFLVLSSINLHLCICATLFKPSRFEQETKIKQSLHTRKTTTSCVRFFVAIKHLRNTGFVLFLINTLSWNFAYGVITLHLPNYLAVNGSDHQRISLVFLIFAMSNTTGRFCGTLLSSRNKINNLIITAIVCGICGLLTVSFYYYSTFLYGCEMFAVQIGFFVGIPNCTQMTVAVRFIELAQLPDAVNFVYFFSGIGVFSGPYIAGFLYTVTRSYVYSFVTAGVVLLVGCACAVTAEIASRSTRHKTKEPNELSEECDVTLSLKSTQPSDVHIMYAIMSMSH